MTTFYYHGPIAEVAGILIFPQALHLQATQIKLFLMLLLQMPQPGFRLLLHFSQILSITGEFGMVMVFIQLHLYQLLLILDHQLLLLL